jgi:hypothetical protein
MEGNPLLNPVGSLPPQVYWRRRAMAGVLAVLLIWLMWSWFPGGGGGAKAAGPTPGKSRTSSPAPATSPSTPVVTTSAPAVQPPAVKPQVTVTSPAPQTTTAKVAAKTPTCASTAVKITLTADHTLYPSGVNAHFVLSVANVGKAACRIDVGTANRGFVVTSGNDRIWSSSDCSKTSHNVAVFKAGESVSYSHAWTRQRSSAAGCAAAGTGARPGTYKVIAHLGDVVSSQAVFRLT